MSNKTYAVQNNSPDGLDVKIPFKEPPSPPSSEAILRSRYIQIAIAVALYWYEENFNITFLKNFIDI